MATDTVMVLMTALSGADDLHTATTMKGRLARVAIVVIAVGLAAVSLAQATSALLTVSNPTVAHALDPMNTDATVAIAMADLSAASDRASGKAIADAMQIARKNLAIEPTHAASLRTLAFANSAIGNDRLARAQLDMAARLSRRDLGTQLALIEFCVKAADTPCALQHYATALATNEGATPLLTDRLLAALDDPEIRTGLAPYIREGRPWIARVMASGVDGKTSSRALALAFVAARRVPDTPPFEAIIYRLLARLYADNATELARRLFLSLPGADATILSQTRFTSTSTTSRREPIHWQAIAQETANAEFSNDGSGNVLVATAFVTTSTLVARKLLFLRPGQYRVAQRVSMPETDAAIGEWRLVCRDQRASVAAVLPARGGSQIVTIVPCGAYVVELWVRGATGAPATLTVNNIEILPLRESADGQ